MGVAVQYWWWVLALVLMAGEVLAPGFFLLWIGIAAAVMGAIAWAVPRLGALPQMIVFVVLACLSCFLYGKFIRARLARRDGVVARLLSPRGDRMIGRRYVLIEAIVNGRGMARVGNRQWIVAGPDLPVGVEVEVIGVDGVLLKVRAAA